MSRKKSGDARPSDLNFGLTENCERNRKLSTSRDFLLVQVIIKLAGSFISITNRQQLKRRFWLGTAVVEKMLSADRQHLPAAGRQCRQMRVYDCRLANSKPPVIEAKTPDSVDFISFQHNLRKVTLMIFTSFGVGAQLQHVFNANQSLLLLNWMHQHIIWQFYMTHFHAVCNVFWSKTVWLACISKESCWQSEWTREAKWQIQVSAS